MAKRKAKHSQFNKVPKYCTGDLDGSCVVYELRMEDHRLTTIEAMFNAVHVVRYDGNDTVIEDPVGENAMSFFLEIRTGTFLPEKVGDMELTWFEAEDGGNEITIDEILTMCSI
jgi:hypothetical protein